MPPSPTRPRAPPTGPQSPWRPGARTSPRWARTISPARHSSPPRRCWTCSPTRVGRAGGACAGPECPMLLTLSVVGQIGMTPAIGSRQQGGRGIQRTPAPRDRARPAARTGRGHAGCRAVSPNGCRGAGPAEPMAAWCRARRAGRGVARRLGRAAREQEPDLAAELGDYERRRRRRRARAGCRSSWTTPTCWSCRRRPHPADSGTSRAGAPARLGGQVPGVGGRQVHARRHALGHGDPEPRSWRPLSGLLLSSATRVTPSAQHLRRRPCSRARPRRARGRDSPHRCRGPSPAARRRRAWRTGRCRGPLAAGRAGSRPVGDALHGLAQLRPAVAALGAEHVAGQALGVRTDQRRGRRPVTPAARSPRAKARCSWPSTSPLKL